MNACSRRSIKIRSLSLQALESRRLFDASSEVLVDLSYRSSVNESAIAQNGIFFVRDDERYGTELWATDVTGAAPHLVADLTLGALGSNLTSVTPMDGGVYFIKSISGVGDQLWRSDGTASGTHMVADNVVTIQRTYTEKGLVVPIPNDGSHVYFMDSTEWGLWAASDQGNVVQQLTTNDSFVEAVSGDWRPLQVESFQETKSGFSVFMLTATGLSGDQSGVHRRFFGITDGTPEGTRVSNFSVRPSSSLTEAVALSSDKLMFVERANEGSRVLTIDRQGTVELLKESVSSPPIEFVQSGSHWSFSTTVDHKRMLFRTDGTVDGTHVVTSAGSIHSSPVVLSDGSLLTLHGENYITRNFQVTDPETLATTTLDFIAPSDEGLIRELFGSISVGVDKFFFVEATGSNARRLMMADTRARTVTTVLEGNPNEAIGAPVLRGDNLFFTHVAPTHTDLIQFNTVSETSVILASVATDGWQGILIDAVGEDSLVGFMQGADSASIFKLRFADSKLDTVSLVDEVTSIADLYSDAINDNPHDSLWKLDAKTLAFATGIEVNGQPALKQHFAYDTSANGLTRLVSPSLAQPSELRSGAIYAYDDQPLYRAGGKVVYHSGYRVVRPDGSYWHELWSTADGKSAQKLIEVGDGSLIPLGVVEDRLHFLTTGPTTTLYRTNEDATAVEVVTETPWGGQGFYYHNYELLYRPALQDDPQRILFRRMDDAREPGVWEIKGNPPVLAKIVEHSVFDPCNAPYYAACSVRNSSGAMYVDGTESRGPLVEVVPTEESTERMVAFFGEDSSVPLSEQKTARLYRLEGTWVGVVPGLDSTYSFWSRPDGSAGATRISDIDLAPFQVDHYPIGLADFAVTADAVVLIARSKVIRLDRDGTYSFVDVPTLADSSEFYRPAYRLYRNPNVKLFSLHEQAFLHAGSSVYTNQLYVLSPDARSVREVNIEGEMHGYAFEQLKDDARHYVLTSLWDHLSPARVTRVLQDVETIELDIDEPESTLSLAADRVIVRSAEQTLHDSTSHALFSLSVQSAQHDAIITVDVGSAAQSSQFPLGGVSLSLAQRSVVRLVGTTSSPVTYQTDDASLTISIGGLTIRVLDPGDVTIQDEIVTFDRNWSFSTGNDDVEIRPSGTNETEIVERIRNVVIRVVGPAVGEGESPNASISKWRVNTRTGDDKLTVDPDVAAIALLSIVSDLDNESVLKVNLPAASGPLSVTQQNGRTLANTSIAGLQVQLDSTRRPNHNLVSANDADNNGSINALDALRIINTISRRNRVGESNADVMFGDTNGDGRTTPLDALLVINYLARQHRLGQVVGEGEGSRKKVGWEPPVKESEKVGLFSNEW